MKRNGSFVFDSEKNIFLSLSLELIQDQIGLFFINNAFEIPVKGWSQNIFDPIVELFWFEGNLKNDKRFIIKII